MFDLEKREKYLILFLIITLLAGTAVLYCKRSHSKIDVRIKAFEPADALPGSATKININEADIDELATLPGIGKALSARIIEYRAANGPFSSVEDLRKIKGIKGSLFEKIKDRIAIE